MSVAVEISDSLSAGNLLWKYWASKTNKTSSIDWIFVSAFKIKEWAEIADALTEGNMDVQT